MVTLVICLICLALIWLIGAIVTVREEGKSYRLGWTWPKRAAGRLWGSVVREPDAGERLMPGRCHRAVDRGWWAFPTLSLVLLLTAIAYILYRLIGC